MIGMRRALMTAACFVIVQFWPASAAELKIVHIDIGQGDSTLILGPPAADGSRVSVLVDAGDITFQGGQDGGRIVNAVLAKNGIRELDFFIATHYDADHVGGIITGQSHILAASPPAGGLGADHARLTKSYDLVSPSLESGVSRYTPPLIRNAQAGPITEGETDMLELLLPNRPALEVA